MIENFFTSESVSKGHPDKLADQISDAVLDEFLRQDKGSNVACETFITDGLVIVGGEAHSEAYVDIPEVAREVIRSAGYTPEFCFDPNNCGVINTLHAQSPDIHNSVMNRNGIGAGDQGIMFGYAVDETPVYMPLTIFLANKTMFQYDDLRQGNPSFRAFGPDAKCQYTVFYENGEAKYIDTILISAQHAEYITQNEVKDILIKHLIPRKFQEFGNLITDETKVMINPSGRFVIGGPKGDTGLTGRKIIVDTYGGRGAHGGGAFSGKDATKVDRSGAYMARYLAKNIVASHCCKECLVQLSYAIGVAKPVSIYIKTDAGKATDEKLMKIIKDNCMDMLTPNGIINKFGLDSPIYRPTATYGHFGYNIPCPQNWFSLYPWEETDLVKLFESCNI